MFLKKRERFVRCASNNELQKGYKRNWQLEEMGLPTFFDNMTVLLVLHQQLIETNVVCTNTERQSG